MQCHIKLTWNGTVCLDGQATMVCAADILRAHFEDQFAGPTLRPWLRRNVRIQDLLLKLGTGETVSVAFKDASGSATGEITPR